jgi:hypothetical protein
MTAWARSSQQQSVFWTSAAFLLLLAAYNAVLWWGPGFQSREGVVVQVVAQKLVAVAALAWIATQAFGPATGSGPRP